MLAGLLVALLAATPGGDASLEQVAAALRHAPCWHSEFTQRYVPAGFETGASERGTLIVAFPARLRFDYAAPASRVFATDGAIARHVDPLAGSCTAVRLDAGTWGRLPLAAILDPGAARAAFAVAVTGRTMGLTALEPTPELASIEVVVDGNGLPWRVSVIDGSGNRNEFTFTSWKAYSEPAADLFRPALPGAQPCSPDEG
jgi:outer membrane lipoprotein-sorting protein